MSQLEKLGSPFANNDAGCHRVACRYSRQNRRISDAEAIKAVDPKFAVDHGHRVAAHLRRTRLMPEGGQPIAYVLF